MLSSKLAHLLVAVLLLLVSLADATPLKREGLASNLAGQRETSKKLKGLSLSERSSDFAGQRETSKKLKGLSLSERSSDFAGQRETSKKLKGLSLSERSSDFAGQREGPSPKKLPENFPLPRRAASTSASSSSVSAGSTFCRAFVTQCYKTALAGQTGDVTVSHSCGRDGGQGSPYYTYTCKRGDELITTQVLKAMGQEFNTRYTVSVTTGTRVIRSTIKDISTVLDVTTTEVRTATDATVTNTFSTEITQTKTKTVPSMTIATTTVIPYTTTSTMTTSTLTKLTTTTTTAFSGTETNVFIGTAEVPVYQVVVRDVDESEGVQRRAPGAFCFAFSHACASACESVSSTMEYETCEGTQKTSSYLLACICANGQRATQGALNNIAQDRKIRSITVKSTSTAFVTAKGTTTVGTKSYSTKHVTQTTEDDVTSTIFETTTTKQGVTTQFTGISSAAWTQVTTVPDTTTEIVTTTTHIPTTTNIVLAATGFVHGFDSTSGADLGTLAEPLVGNWILLYQPPINEGTPLEFMAVRDGPTGLYKLTIVGDPTDGILNYFYEVQNRPFKNGTADYATFTRDATSICGAAGSAPGPFVNKDTPCETFVFSPFALDSTPGATADTVNLQPFWINQEGQTPSNHTGWWMCSDEPSREIAVIADKQVFIDTWPTVPLLWFNLRFPFSS